MLSLRVGLEKRIEGGEVGAVYILPVKIFESGSHLSRMFAVGIGLQESLQRGRVGGISNEGINGGFGGRRIRHHSEINRGCTAKHQCDLTACGMVSWLLHLDPVGARAGIMGKSAVGLY